MTFEFHKFTKEKFHSTFVAFTALQLSGTNFSNMWQISHNLKISHVFFIENVLCFFLQKRFCL